MAFVLFGTRHKAESMQSGEFFCPQCRSRQPYERKVVRKYGTLYFMPVVSMGEQGEYVECSSCQGTFVPDVLNHDPEAVARDFEAEVLKGMRRVMVHMMMADDEIAEQEIETIQEIIRRLAGHVPSEQAIRDEAYYVCHASERDLLADLSELSIGLNDHGKELVVKAAYWVAGADGRLEDEEEALVFKVGASLSMSRSHVQAVIDSMTVSRG